MIKKFKTSLQLVKISFKYIKQDGELFLYTILSLVATLVVLASFVGGQLFFSGALNGEKTEITIQSNNGTANIETENSGTVTEDTSGEIVITSTEITEEEPITTMDTTIRYLLLFGFYFIFTFISLFFNTAIITSVQRRIEGHDNKFGDGIRDAFKHIKQIIIWSVISAAVTTILKILQNKFGENSIIGRIIIGIVGGMWNILTFFSFPLMIIQGMGPKTAIKESGSLFKKTWGERAILHVGVGFLFSILIILCMIIGMIIIFSGFMITGIVFMVVSLLILIILSSTTDTIIKTILLHYANTGVLPGGIEGKETIMNLVKTPKI